jgi:hypothetical protein
MKKKLFFFSSILFSIFFTGCDVFKQSADSIRRPVIIPETSTTTPSSTVQYGNVSTSSAAKSSSTSTLEGSVSSDRRPELIAIDTTAWQRHSFKELGFSIQLPFASKDISLMYKEGKVNEKQPMSAQNPLMYWYKGFLKGQQGDYAFLGSVSENYVSEKEWQITEVKTFSTVGDEYRINEVTIHPLARIPVQGTLVTIFDATRDYYEVIKSPLASERWYGMVFSIPNNKRFKTVALQFKSSDLSLEKVVAAARTIQFAAPQFPLAQASAPAQAPSKSAPAPKRNPGNAPFVVNRSSNPVVCGSSAAGGKNTNWVYSCSDRRDTFVVGETVYGLFRIDSIFKNFRFKSEVYKDGLFQWEHVGDWNTVDEKWGWARSYAMPVVGNVSAGSWEIRFYVDTGDGFSGTAQASVDFWVSGSSPAPAPTPAPQSRPVELYKYDGNGATCMNQPTGGSGTKWWYTCDNQKTVFLRGQTVYGILRVDKVYMKHYFVAEVYKNGVYQWSSATNLNDVDEQNGWNYSFYLPVFANLDQGNWSVNMYIVPQSGSRQFLKNLTFRIDDQVAAPQPNPVSCITTDNALNTLESNPLHAGQ